MKLKEILFFSFPLLVAFAFVTEAAESPGPRLLETAKQGYQAASDKNWDLAIQFFSEAQALEPQTPALLLNLGLAHYREGRLLIADAWLRAYLEAFPDSPKRAEVKELIKKIEVKAQAKANALLKTALETVRHFPDEIEADKKQASGEIAYILALTGDIETAQKAAQNTMSGAVNSASLKRYLGENLIAAHNYERVNALLEDITDPDERNRLLLFLGNRQLERNEESYLNATVEKMSPSSYKTNLLHIWLLYLTRVMRPEEAEKILDKTATVKEKINLGQTLIMGYLKKGYLDQAKQLAIILLHDAKRNREIKASDLNTARILTGEGSKVFKQITKAKVTPADAWSKAREFYKLIVVSAWSGHLDLAIKSCTALEDFAAVYPSSITKDYLHMACGYLALDQTGIDGVLGKIKDISTGSARNFRISLFWRLLFRNHIEDMRRFIEATPDSVLRAQFLFQLSKTYRDQGDEEKAAALFEQSYKLAVASNAIYVLKKIGIEAAKSGFVNLAIEAFREERIARWIGLARYWERDESITDLPDFIEKGNQADLRKLAVPLIQAADSWQRALLFIQGVEAWHEQNK